jgi:hypothetical protein
VDVAVQQPFPLVSRALFIASTSRNGRLQ